MEVIRNVAEIDRKLREISIAANANSDAAVRQVFADFSMDFSELYRELPPDPFSDEYFAFQMNLYETLAGKTYQVNNEVSVFDVEDAVTRPFPYRSGNTATAGMHLSALGFVISGITLPYGSKIIEFGAGWGNTTLTLALLGYDVTVVEIEERFCELIRNRAKLHNVKINVINGGFLSCDSMTEQYDAALFYECFHHCDDHMRLLRGLHRIIKPSGTVYLGAEPIKEDFPIPWGLRLDGESLWAIRQNGWMELGYRVDYFRQALERTGWSGSVTVSQDAGWANLWRLKRVITDEFSVSTSDISISTSVTKALDGTIAADRNVSGFLSWGPYVQLARGGWDGQIHVRNGSARAGTIDIDVCDNAGQTIIARRTVDLSSIGPSGSATIPFYLHSASENLEIRVVAHDTTTVSIDAVGFTPNASIEPTPRPWPVPKAKDLKRSARSLLGRAARKIGLRRG